MTRTAALLVMGLLLGLPVASRALPAGSSIADEALRLCRLAEEQADEGRIEIFSRGLELAEAALAADPHDARAHFALFCNLGRRVQASGLALAHPGEVLRSLRALDAALALAPEDPDVMTAKGALLMSLPRWFGGDPEAGETWLRRALFRDPQHCAARRYLADLLARRGEWDAARLLRDPC